MATFSWAASSAQSLMTTELNSLDNGSTATATSAFDNTSTGYMYADFELYVDFGTAPTAGTVVELYLVPSVDGTNYADSTAASAEGTHYVGAFIMRNSADATYYYVGTITRPIQVPPLKFKAKLKNSSGQAFPASGSTLKAVFYRLQSA